MQGESYIRRLAPRYARCFTLLSSKSNTWGEAENFSQAQSLHGGRELGIFQVPGHSYREKAQNLFKSQSLYEGRQISLYRGGEIRIFSSPRNMKKYEGMMKKYEENMNEYEIPIYFVLIPTYFFIFSTYFFISQNLYKGKSSEFFKSRRRWRSGGIRKFQMYPWEKIFGGGLSKDMKHVKNKDHVSCFHLASPVACV